jgi:hypothetical protein
MQRLYAITFKPSWSWTVAATGQTFSHGAVSHIWHIIGWFTACTSSIHSANCCFSSVWFMSAFGSNALGLCFRFGSVVK